MIRTAVLLCLTVAVAVPLYAQDAQAQNVKIDGLSTVDPAVVTIRGPGFDGAGFVVDDAGHILTAAHVVRKAKRVEVKLAGGARRSARVTVADTGRDLALLDSDDAALPSVTLSPSTGLRPGQDVFALGAPMGLEHTVTKGVVSALSRRVGGQDFLQIDAALNPGNSGGPVVDDRGAVVGMSTVVVKDAQNLGFAVPSEVLAGFLEESKIPYRVTAGENLVPVVVAGAGSGPSETPGPEETPVSIPMIIGIAALVSLITAAATSLLVIRYVMPRPGAAAQQKPVVRTRPRTADGDDLSDIEITLH